MVLSRYLLYLVLPLLFLLSGNYGLSGCLTKIKLTGERGYLKVSVEEIGYIRDGVLNIDLLTDRPLKTLRFIRSIPLRRTERAIVEGRPYSISGKLVDVYGKGIRFEDLLRGDPLLELRGAGELKYLSLRVCHLDEVVAVKESYQRILTSSGLKLRATPEVIKRLRDDTRNSLKLLWINPLNSLVYRYTEEVDPRCPLLIPPIASCWAELSSESSSLRLQLSFPWFVSSKAIQLKCGDFRLVPTRFEGYHLIFSLPTSVLFEGKGECLLEVLSNWTTWRYRVRFSQVLRELDRG